MVGKLDSSIWSPLKWPARAALVLLGHVGLAALILTGIWALDRYTRLLYGDEVPLLYERVPLRWAFDTMDAGVLAVFLVYGLVEAIRELRKR
jgi:hypothetical protein